MGQVHQRLIELYFKATDYQKSIEHLSPSLEYLEDNRARALCLCYAAWSYERLGQLDLSIKTYREGLEELSDLNDTIEELTIKNPQVDTTKFELQDFHEVPTTFKADIENVKNTGTLIPSKPFTIIDTRFDEDSPEREVIVPLAESGFEFTASFSPLPTQSISTVNFRSYADIRLSRLRTFSGDIDRVKVYARNKDAFGDFEVVSDQQIESPELLFNVFGAGNQRIGFFLNQEQKGHQIFLILLRRQFPDH